MSGGSYSYLCYASFPEILGRVEDMKTIERRLIDLGAKDIAKDVRNLINYCEDVRQTIDCACEQLSDVFRAVEWFDSYDIGEDAMKTRLEKYRNER